MKQKLTIIAPVILLIVVIVLMAGDLFLKKDDNYNNPYEYDLKDLKEIDPDQICYTEVKQFRPELENLLGICTDNNDNIYVSGTSKILVYNRDGSMIFSFNTGSDANCMAVGSDNEILIGKKDHIEVWNSKGELVKSWEVINENVIITSLAISENSVFVADAGNKIVYHYNRDGDLTNTIGGNNIINGVKGFIIPSPYFDVLVGHNDEIWAINTGMHSFEAYKKNGDLIYTWQKSSMQIDGFSGCCNPSHVAILSNGSFVTSEKGIERIKVHLPSGEYKCVVAGPDSFDEGTTGLDLAVDSDDRIIVLDPERGLIRIFTEIL